MKICAVAHIFIIYSVSQENKKSVRTEHESLSPLELKKELDKLKEKLGRELIKLRKKRATR